MEDIKQNALKLHQEYQGKIEINSKVSLDKDTLSLAYTPGVAAACQEIDGEVDNVWRYTSKGNLVAVVTDGSAVLGLGNIGPEASMPVMEGKAILFKEFGCIDGFPICLNIQDPDEIVKTVKNMSATWGGINLEDISAPRCFEIERRLKQELDIPVFHDDQHGTAIAAASGVINALKLLDKDFSESRVVINGAGAGGVALTKICLDLNFKDVILCDSRGIVHQGREQGMNWIKSELAEITNKDNLSGNLAEAMAGSDVFLGVSVPGTVTKEMVASMNKDPIVMAMANPVPEIYPEDAQAAGAKVIGTGRSDYPNQVNNVLAFPGIFRGALDVRASDITETMKIAAAEAIASMIPEHHLEPDYVIPDVFDKSIVPNVVQAVKQAAYESGVAQSS